MSLNRWGFKWCLNVGTLSHSLMSAGKEFQMDGVQQKKRAERIQSVSGERPAPERRINAEPELVRESVAEIHRLWSAPCESVEPPCRQPAI